MFTVYVHCLDRCPTFVLTAFDILFWSHLAYMQVKWKHLVLPLPWLLQEKRNILALISGATVAFGIAKHGPWRRYLLLMEIHLLDSRTTPKPGMVKTASSWGSDWCSTGSDRLLLVSCLSKAIRKCSLWPENDALWWHHIPFPWSTSIRHWWAEWATDVTKPRVFYSCRLESPLKAFQIHRHACKSEFFMVTVSKPVPLQYEQKWPVKWSLCSNQRQM